MKKVVLSGMIGNALEWYDYALYSQFVPMIARHFFPDSELAELNSMVVFAAGFFMRPVGAVVFGYLGDIHGRRIALTIGILAMAMPTATIGLLPSYASIGITATILLCVVRLIQGFALGGEFSGCISYIIEHAPAKNRGLAGSAAFMSMALGMLLGTFTGVSMSLLMEEEALFSWGWRIPFVIGLFVGLIGLYIRFSLPESPAFADAKSKGELSKSPISETVRYYLPELLLATTLYINVMVPYYVCTIYVETFMQSLGYGRGESGLVSAIVLLTMIFVFPISGRLSDKWGRKKVLTLGSIAIIVCSYPSIYILGYLDITYAVLAQIIFAASIAFYMGPMPATAVELFPTKIRFSGLGLSHNTSSAIFGGTAPVMAMVLQRYTGDHFSIGYYVGILALFNLLVLIYFYKETSSRSVSESHLM